MPPTIPGIPSDFPATKAASLVLFSGAGLLPWTDRGRTPSPDGRAGVHKFRWIYGQDDLI